MFCFQPGGDVVVDPKVLEKAGKAPSPFEGEVKVDENKEQVQSNGIIQNGLEEEKVFR